ncbi:MAG: hypothetical protein ACTSRA_03230 [Promethearchaeota archaeon]
MLAMNPGRLAIGILLTLAGAAINNIGILLQKLDINRAGMEDDSNLAFFMKRPVWILGILMQTVIVIPFFFLGIDFLGVTLAQPLATSGLVIFVLGSFFILKENLTGKEWFGVSVMIASIFMLSLSGVSGNVTMNVFYPRTFTYKLLLIAACVTVLGIAGTIIVKLRRFNVAFGYGILMGISYALVSISAQFITPALGSLFSGTNTGLVWSLIILGVIGIIGGTILGILLAQEAFKTSRAIDVVPASQAIINILPVIAGVYLFGQEIQHLILFIPALILIITSASMLARFQK